MIRSGFLFPELFDGIACQSLAGRFAAPGPYLAHGWAERGAELRVQVPGQSREAATRAAVQTFNRKHQMPHPCGD